MKTKQLRKRVKEVLLIAVFSALAFFLTGFVFLFFENFTLESYQQAVQGNLLGVCLLFSFFFLLGNFYRRKWMKALLSFLLPILIYSLINFTTEAILYGSELKERTEAGKLAGEEALSNINLSICDLKIILSLLGLILWCWVWLEVK